MTTSPFTLAALASAAVEDRSFTRASSFTSGQIGNFDTALLDAEDGERLLIRIPTTQAAHAELEGDLRGTNAMSAGIRTRLPFAVTKAIGHVEHEPFDGLVVTFLEGVPIDINGLEPHTGVADSLGMAIASIHMLPTGFVDDYGLPNSPAGLVRDTLSNLVDRASYAADLPIPLITRWNAALSEDPWWEFESTVVHGDLNESVVLMRDGRVSGILGWHGLAIGDPAQDLGWCLSTVNRPTADAIMSAYTTRREGEADLFIGQRAQLHGELALAHWLMHGVEFDDATIQDDAKAMLDELARNVEAGAVPDLVQRSHVDTDDDTHAVVASMLAGVSGAPGAESSADESPEFATSDLIDPADAVAPTPQIDGAAKVSAPTDDASDEMAATSAVDVELSQETEPLLGTQAVLATEVVEMNTNANGGEADTDTDTDTDTDVGTETDAEDTAGDHTDDAATPDRH